MTRHAAPATLRQLIRTQAVAWRCVAGNTTSGPVIGRRRGGRGAPLQVTGRPARPAGSGSGTRTPLLATRDTVTKVVTCLLRALPCRYRCLSTTALASYLPHLQSLTFALPRSTHPDPTLLPRPPASQQRGADPGRPCDTVRASAWPPPGALQRFASFSASHSSPLSYTAWTRPPIPAPPRPAPPNTLTSHPGSHCGTVWRPSPMLEMG